MIASGHLKSEGFPLAKWYAEQCNHMDGRRHQHRWPERFHALQTNKMMCKLISTLLQIGSPYPGDPDQDYLIIDHLCDLQISLSKHLLDDEEFDIFIWYWQELCKRRYAPKIHEEQLPRVEWDPDPTRHVARTRTQCVSNKGCSKNGT